jgi:uncharacterized protein YqcC (DUF446 family)
MQHPLWRLLEDLQTELETQGRWQSLPPSPEKMMSTLPFSIDTLSFLEWLQWVYIARLRALIESGGELPKGAQVLPYAEEAFKSEGLSMPQLLSLISEIDDFLK